MSSATDALEEIRAKTEADGVEFIYAMFVEMHGKPCAKLVPVSALDGLMSDGAGFAGFAAGPMGQDPSSPDILALPDPASYTQLPWQPNVAAMQCDPTVEGELWPYAPRVILRRALEAAAERNLVLKSGVEAEYSLVVRNEDGSLSVADDRDNMTLPCYDAKASPGCCRISLRCRGISTPWDGATTPTTTRTRTDSTSRTGCTPTRSLLPTG